MELMSLMLTSRIRKLERAVSMLTRPGSRCPKCLRWPNLWITTVAPADVTTVPWPAGTCPTCGARPGTTLVVNQEVWDAI